MKVKTVLALSLLLLTAALFVSCGGKGNAGPSGADGGYVMTFQTGAQPYASYAGTADTRIANGVYTNGNVGGGQSLYIGSAATLLNLRFLVKFDLSGVVPDTVTVSKAYLTLYTSTAAYGNPSVAAFRVSSPWDQGTQTSYLNTPDGATWVSSTATTLWTNNGGDFSTPAVSDTVTVPLPLNEACTLSLDTSMVKSWITTPSTNYGVIIIGAQEGINADNYSAFYTSELTTSPLYRPKLTVYLKP